MQQKDKTVVSRYEPASDAVLWVDSRNKKLKFRGDSGWETVNDGQHDDNAKDIAALKKETATIKTSVTKVSKSVTTLSEELDSAKSEVEADIKEMEAKASELEEKTSELGASVDAVKEDTKANAENIETNAQDISANAGNIKKNAEEIDSLKLTPVTYAELKALRDGGKLTAGVQYRITDYACTTVQAYTRSAGHCYDIVVTADDTETLNENVRAILHEGDTYFADNDLSAWELKYTIDNDAERFAWADATDGKGVVFYMKDEFGNECPYDFKNIQFKRCKVTAGKDSLSSLDGMYLGMEAVSQTGLTLAASDYIWCYTFSMASYELDGEELTVDYTVQTDSSLNNRKSYDPDGGGYAHPVIYCENNRIAVYRTGVIVDDGTTTQPQSLNDIVLQDVPKYYEGDDQIQARVEFNSCAGNTFGMGCHGISALENFSNNTFGNWCYSNTFGNWCYSNTFGNWCYSNTFGDGYDSNTFGDSCYSNTFGDGCDSNTFGDGCNYNTFGDSCYSNTFGNWCYHNSITQSPDGATDVFARHNILDNGVAYVTLTSDETIDSTTYIQNVHICQGVKGTSSGVKTVTVSRGLAYQTEVKAAGSVTVEV